tara:strand:- start:524 stop:1552 length:1029 start_codon:yes stop_codon:yes gene_type:complete
MAVLGAAAAGGGITPTISFLGSQSWTPAYDMEAYVYVIGAGGSGCAGSNSADFLSGGGAGGCAISKLTLSSGTAYTVTIGAGGARVTSTSGYTVGNAGGNSSLSGSDISTMTGNGGSGGLRIQYETLGSGNGAAGGTATGGTLANFTGGKGGGITSQLSSARSGGGAVGLWATGNDGPNALGSSGALNKFQAGGNPNYDLGTYTGDEILNTASYYGGNSAKSIPSISPFGMDVTAVEHQGYLPKGNYYANGSTVYSVPYVRLTGSPQPYQGYYDNSANLSGNVAPAFHGGVAMCASLGCYGGSATLGGGGGAGGIRSGNTGTAYGGVGGTGAVIIFPLSIGS